MLSKINGAEIILNSQYVKDFSLENPNAPQIYACQDLDPETNVTVDLRATKIEKGVFELTLSINVTTESEGKTMFIVEVVYAGIFTIKGVNEEEVKKNLFIECSTLLFPFARSLIVNAIVSANFPPIRLDAIDFETLYAKERGL